MSRQSFIENFFKTKGNPSPTVKMENIKKRSSSLSLKRTPNKTQKLSEENRNACDVIILSSDDEDIWENTPKSRPLQGLTQRSNESEETFSDSSASTILYSSGQSLPSPSILRKSVTPTTPKKEPLGTQDNNYLTQRTQQTTQTPIKTEACNETPQKSSQCFQTPKSPLSSSKALTSQPSSSSSHKSPQCRDKYFSPVKNKRVSLKPANSVKRSLNNELRMSARILFEDDLFGNACEGMDDKTVLLLQIINKYLETPSLRCLLDKESQTLLSNCLLVVKPGMKLVCRLYWRKEGWYKKEQVKKICSDEDEMIDESSFKDMMDSLIENRLIEQDNSDNMTFDQYTSIMKKEELKDICKELKLKMNSKQDAVEALKSFSSSTQPNISRFLTGYTSSNSKRVLKMMSLKAGQCYKLTDLARNTLYRLYIIMYLGMDYNIIREKRLEYTLIYDKIGRETFPINKDLVLDNASVVFKTKDEFDRYIVAQKIYEDFLSSTDGETKCNIAKHVYAMYKNISAEQMESYTQLPQWLQRYTPPHIFVKILESGIQDLKKDKLGGHYLLALEILNCLIGQKTFRQHRKADWYAEKALILHSYLSRSDEAAVVLLEGFRSDLSEEAKDSMRPRARNIATRKNNTLDDHLRHELLAYANKETIQEENFPSKHIEKQPMERLKQRGKVKFETRTLEGRMIQDAEEYCIAEYLYSKEFTDGEHWEGRIAASLFFYLFWDIIYSNPPGVRGVFLSHYQLNPLDLFTDSFYANRKEAIDDRLRVIRSSSEQEVIEIMHRTWTERPEHEFSAFKREKISWENVRAVATCLRPAGVEAICARLATNYRYAHSGFPDLTLWHQHTKRIKFVEVKTDSDKPSMKQLQWMQYLLEHNIEAEFCYVGVHTTRQRCRTKPSTSNMKSTPRPKRAKKVKPEPSVEAQTVKLEPTEETVEPEPVESEV